ncbi:hypothetical protein D3C81_1710280 [compost metagenome]
MQHQQPLFIQLAFAGRLGRRRQFAFRQAVQLAFVSDRQCAVFGRRQQFVGELGAQRRRFLVQRLKFGFIGVGQIGPRQLKVLVGHFNQPTRFRIQF